VYHYIKKKTPGRETLTKHTPTPHHSNNWIAHHTPQPQNTTMTRRRKKTFKFPQETRQIDKQCP